MKSEDQYNDNLEQFFKQHLENHSPELSSNFWEEMEAFIPSKPPFWVLWAGTVKQFLLPTVLLSSLVIVSLFYWKAIQEKENLSILSIDQQMKIQQIKHQNDLLKSRLKRGLSSAINENTTDTLSSKRKINPSEHNESQRSNTTTALGSNNILIAQRLTQKTLISNEIEHHNSITDKPKKVSKNHSVSSFTNSTSTKNSDIIPFLTPNNTPLITRTNPKNTLSQIAQIKRDFLLKSRFSFEGGILFFAQNLKTETITSTGASYGVSLLMNLELSHQWLLQSGLQIKNISSLTITRSYNSFPLNIKRKVLLNSCFLEPKLGFAFNFLTNSKTPETYRSLNIKAAYVDVTSSIALTVPFNQNLRFIIEPNIAYSMTPIVGNEKAFSYGLQLGIRYENH